MFQLGLRKQWRGFLQSFAASPPFQSEFASGVVGNGLNGAVTKSSWLEDDSSTEAMLSINREAQAEGFQLGTVDWLVSIFPVWESDQIQTSFDYRYEAGKGVSTIK
nr:MAG: hypothetical protein H3RhizoLitter14712_000002 [Mitovirus sp.]